MSDLASNTYALQGLVSNGAQLTAELASRAPAISAYPDSGKLGTRPGDDRDRLNFRRADAVDYWEGE